MIDKPYCWLAIPSCTGMQKMVLVWRAKAMLAQEGKYVVGDDDDFLTSPQYYNPEQCELVIFGTEESMTKNHAKRLTKVAHDRGVSVRLIKAEDYTNKPTTRVRVRAL